MLSHIVFHYPHTDNANGLMNPQKNSIDDYKEPILDTKTILLTETQNLRGLTVFKIAQSKNFHTGFLDPVIPITDNQAIVTSRSYKLGS